MGMQIVDAIIKNIKIVTPTGIYKAGIAIDDGKIVSISKDTLLPKASSIINPGDCFALPGVIDTHVHLFLPGFVRETFETGTMAAAVGGVTTVLEMPTGGKHATTTVEGFRWKKEIGERESIVDFGLYGGEITKKNETLEIANLVKEGVVGFKITLGGYIPSERYGPVENDGVVMEAFQRIAKTSSIASLHAESQQLFIYFRDKLIAKGRKDPEAHSEARPNIVEAEAISRAILMAREVGNRVHIAHMSTREGVELVKKAKQMGQRLTAEVCPHHLLLTKKDYQKFGRSVIVNPPLRSNADVEALWMALADGTLDALATDHSALSKEDKVSSRKSIWDTPPGIPGLETSVSLLLSEGINKKRVTLEKFVSFTSENPAKIFGLYPRKGTIQVGSDADITIIDLKKESIIKADQLKCVGDFTPFENWKVKGKPVMTLVRGKVVAQDGEVIAKPGHGHFIHSRVDT